METILLVTTKTAVLRYGLILDLDVPKWRQNKLARNDGVVMSISVTETTLRTSFTVSGGIKDGNWVFNFVK